MENELFDLVLKAQNGDSKALDLIITSVSPTIQSVRKQIKYDRRDDLEQNLIEALIKKILSYDLKQTPDFSSFCRQISNGGDEYESLVHLLQQKESERPHSTG
ncbi:helix-turn-helix domain-containing protein [Paenibacillus sp. GCM10027628]|uniref:helix-turn-helix domain-containing protein n=1 Tax=Paenibacillus sp. GCM10027628 TaxID=3273413 RepID=UPI0036351E9A